MQIDIFEDKMGIFHDFLVKLLPTKDVRIIKLKKEIKEYKIRISELREEINYLKSENIKINNEHNLSIEFYDEHIEEKIIESLLKAKKEVCIAMAWLTSENIISALDELKHNGIKIKMIVDKNDNNRKVILKKPCNILRIVDVNLSNRKYKNYMHNKYCIIDNNKVIDGSYNWSKNAKYNLEHIIIINSNEAVKKYRANFDKIFNNSRYYDNYSIYENVV